MSYAWAAVAIVEAASGLPAVAEVQAGRFILNMRRIPGRRR
jgi:hypothetical protein